MPLNPYGLSTGIPAGPEALACGNGVYRALQGAFMLLALGQIDAAAPLTPPIALLHLPSVGHGESNDEETFFEGSNQIATLGQFEVWRLGALRLGVLTGSVTLDPTTLGVTYGLVSTSFPANLGSRYVDTPLPAHLWCTTSLLGLTDQEIYLGTVYVIMCTSAWPDMFDRGPARGRCVGVYIDDYFAPKGDDWCAMGLLDLVQAEACELGGQTVYPCDEQARRRSGR